MNPLLCSVTVGIRLQHRSVGKEMAVVVNQGDTENVQGETKECSRQVFRKLPWERSGNDSGTTNNGNCDRVSAGIKWMGGNIEDGKKFCVAVAKKECPQLKPETSVCESDCIQPSC